MELQAIVNQKEQDADNYYNEKVENNLSINATNVENDYNSIDELYLSSSFSLLTVVQHPQETNFWCGYSALQSILEYEGIPITGVNDATQLNISKMIWGDEYGCPSSYMNPSDNLLKTNSTYCCPWYWLNGNSSSQYPACNLLADKTNFSYVPYPYGAAGGTTITSSSLKSKIVSTIDNDYPLLMCGTSSLNNSTSRLYGYPANMNIRHWLVIDGYEQNGDFVCYSDPAYHGTGISFANDIPRYYTAPIDKITAFVSTNGIIW